jgi:hypothetical protein
MERFLLVFGIFTIFGGFPLTPACGGSTFGYSLTLFGGGAFGSDVAPFRAPAKAKRHRMRILALLPNGFGVMLGDNLIEDRLGEQVRIVCVLLWHERILARSDRRTKNPQLPAIQESDTTEQE